MKMSLSPHHPRQEIEDDQDLLCAPLGHYSPAPSQREATANLSSNTIGQAAYALVIIRIIQCVFAARTSPPLTTSDKPSC